MTPTSASIAVFVISFIIVSLWLGQSLWIYLDARNKNNRFAVLWGILGLFNFPIPLIVYLIVTRGSEEKCPNCKKVVEKNMVICPHCGYKLGKACKNCGAFMEEDWEYCPKCAVKYEEGDKKDGCI